MSEERGDTLSDGLRTTAPRRSVIKGAGGLALGSLGLGTRGQVAAAPAAQAATPAATGGRAAGPTSSTSWSTTSAWGAGLLWRRPAARHGDAAHRPLRRGVDQAAQFRPRDPVHSFPLGFDDRPLLDPLRQVRGRTGRVPCGLVAWERTSGDILSDAGYATAIYGKWHIGARGAGRRTTGSTSGMSRPGPTMSASGRRIPGMSPSATRLLHDGGGKVSQCRI